MYHFAVLNQVSKDLSHVVSFMLVQNTIVEFQYDARIGEQKTSCGPMLK